MKLRLVVCFIVFHLCHGINLDPLTWIIEQRIQNKPVCPSPWPICRDENGELMPLDPWQKNKERAGDSHKVPPTLKAVSKFGEN